MTLRNLYCPWLLQPDGWQADRVLQLDQRGVIVDILAGDRPADVRLPGPVIPGMVNVHSHAHQRLMAGLSGRRSAEGDSFWSWREQMYAAIGLLAPDDLRVLASWLYLELMEGGYTCQGEFHYPHRLKSAEPLTSSLALIEAAEQIGTALTLLPVWYRYGGFGRAQPGERQRPFILDAQEYSALVRQLERLAAERDRLTIGLAPHSLRAVAVEELSELLGDFPGRKVHIHIAEQPAEVHDCIEHHGCRPVTLLGRHVELDSRWCLIHATHVTEGEVVNLAGAGAVVGLCPTTEADLGDGLFPATEFINQGGRIAIGSDSNLHTSAAGELRLLEWGQRLRRHQRNVLAGGAGQHLGSGLWRHAAQQGAEALGQVCGYLAPGRRADLVVLSPDHPLLRNLGPEAMLDTWVMAEQPGMVDEVWVGGECHVRRGVHRLRKELEPDFVRLRACLARQAGLA